MIFFLDFLPVKMIFFLLDFLPVKMMVIHGCYYWTSRLLSYFDYCSLKMMSRLDFLPVMSTRLLAYFEFFSLKMMSCLELLPVIPLHYCYGDLNSRPLAYFEFFYLMMSFSFLSYPM